MVIPFSNTKLRVPTGFQTLLVGLSTEILRSQPKNIHAFAADYFEKLLERREHGPQTLHDKQTSQEDRYYNNKSFQEEYPVNNPDVNHAATKIQAQYRGHKARRDFEQRKHETKYIADEEQQQEFGYGRETAATPTREEHVPTGHEDRGHDYEHTFEEDSYPQDKHEQERAAVTIQAQFRGFQTRKALRDAPAPTHEPLNLFDQHYQEFENDDEKSPTLQSPRWNESRHSDRQDRSQNLFDDDEINIGENDNIDLAHQSGRSSAKSEGHQRSIDNFQFDHEQRSTSFHDDNDMNDSNLDKAATRIQASYRGYKTRKELGSTTVHSTTGHEQHHHPPAISPQMLDGYDSGRSKNILSPSAEGNKAPVSEDDDNAAAVKIQAAYRGYRVRKDLDK